MTSVHQCTCPICQDQADHPDKVIHHQINLILSRADEQQRRWYAALEAQRHGHGGIKRVAQITGLSERTIRRGKAELEEQLKDRPTDRVRLPGAGRPCVEKKPDIEPSLTALVSDELAGKPTGGPHWIRRSLARLRAALADAGFALSRETIRRLLKKQKIRPRANRKRLTAKDHPDRDTQFRYIQQQRRVFEAAGWPLISVDTKNKELIGPFKQAGTTWSAQPTDVYMHDFPSAATARAVPYGIYDTARNEGYVQVGQSADTPEFAVDAIVAWWRDLGQRHYRDAPELLILADCGGSNGYRSRNWKRQLQVELVDAYGLSVTVCHYPRGASKWNPIEHRLFSEITKTWAGTPLDSFEVMLACLAETTTESGLMVEAYLVERDYAKGIRVSDEEMAALAVEHHATCPQWNYTIRPRQNGK